MRLRDLALVSVLALGAAARAGAQPYPGPFGLKWGRSPAVAKFLLAKRVTFVSEKQVAGAPAGTVDQHYSGPFGKLPTTDIFLRFFKGQFFYMAVTLSTTDAKWAAKVWEAVVLKMQDAYGNAARLTPAPNLASGKAIPDNLPVEARGSVMPLFWNEQTKKDADALYQLRDLQIRTGLWDPFAGWKFDHQVVVQTFIDQSIQENGKSTTLTPVWIFAKLDLLKRWKTYVPHAVKLVEPRDY